MPTIRPLKLDELRLDLRNFRTIPQKDEAAALHALITLDPDAFWALAESLLDESWHGTENVIVLEAPGPIFIVQEGNRRVGALKLILAQISRGSFPIPTTVNGKIAKISAGWKTEHTQIQCLIFGASELSLARRLVNLTHARDQRAGRLIWNSVAKSRIDRDENGKHEPGLDLLESYLENGRNISTADKEFWAGVYSLTVLDEAVGKLSSSLGVADSKAVAAEYPKNATYRSSFENLLHDIGTKTCGFQELRDQSADFRSRYGFPVHLPSLPMQPTGSTANPGETGQGSGPPDSVSGAPSRAKPLKGRRPRASLPNNDPKSVTRKLKKFHPFHPGREKLAALLVEASTLNIDKYPHAFCFLLRSMFEISAKCYCNDHKKTGGPSAIDTKTGMDKPLVKLLREICAHLIGPAPKHSQISKDLHNAMAVLADRNSLLSVDSMNQLVHNTNFSVNGVTIAPLFHSSFALLEAMNA